jgi:Rod binding domain-containing protein
MSEIVSTGSVSSSGLNGGTAIGKKSSKDTPEAVAKAASQFEGLLIGQLLQSARGSDGEGWLGTDENEAGSTLAEMSEQALSSALATKGGLGLAKLVTKGLEKTVEQSTRSEHGG